MKKYLLASAIITTLTAVSLQVTATPIQEKTFNKMTQQDGRLLNKTFDTDLNYVSTVYSSDLYVKAFPAYKYQGNLCRDAEIVKDGQYLSISACKMQDSSWQFIFE